MDCLDKVWSLVLGCRESLLEVGDYAAFLQGKHTQFCLRCPLRGAQRRETRCVTRGRGTLRRWWWAAPHGALPSDPPRALLMLVAVRVMLDWRLELAQSHRRERLGAEGGAGGVQLPPAPQGEHNKSKYLTNVKKLLQHCFTVVSVYRSVLM